MISVKRMNHLFLMRITFCLVLSTLITPGHTQSEQTVANFEYASPTVSRWGIYESPSGTWYENPNYSMTLYPKAYWLSDGGSTTYARLLWDQISSAYVFWSLNVPPTVCTSIVITYRGYAQSGSPSYTAQFRAYGEISTGATQNGTNITNGLSVSNNTWTVVTCTLGAYSTGLLSDIWVELSGGSGTEVQGIDIGNVTVNGVNVLQIDTTGSIGSWAERDWSGWAHGYIGTAYVSAPAWVGGSSNVGEFQIWSGDGGAVKRQFVNLPQSQWVNLNTERYLHFDITTDPNTSPGKVGFDVELYSESGASGNGYFITSDTIVPSTWTHEVIDVSQWPVFAASTISNQPDIWRIEFLVINYATTSSLQGFYVDNLVFSSSSINSSYTTPYITPSSPVTVEPGTQELFTVNGGDPPFSWSLSTIGFGSLGTSTGSSVTFTAASTAGSVILSVTDANNIWSSVTINIVPSSAQGWLPDFQLTQGEIDATTPVTVVNQGESNLCVVWSDRRDGNYEIYFKHSLNQGMTWSMDTQLSQSSCYAWFPSAAVLNQTVNVVWSDFRSGNWEIYFIQSLDGGISWGPEQKLIQSGVNSTTPSITMDSSGIYVAWCDSGTTGTYNINFIKSIDGGNTWSTATIIMRDGGDIQFPHLLTNDGVLHLVWEDWSLGNAEIYYCYSTNSGISWSSVTSLSPIDNYTHSHPGLAVESTNIYVTWDDTRYGSYVVFMMESFNNGINWNPETEVTLSDGYDSWCPNIVALDTSQQAFWRDDRNGNAEIFYSSNPFMTSSGIGFVASDTTISSTLLSAISGGMYTYITWVDNRTGINQIFFSTDAFLPSIEDWWIYK